jgi:hypothetical protein
MSAQDDLDQLAERNGFDPLLAGRDELLAHLQALESLYLEHPAQRALEELHRYLYPERYSAVPLHEWDAGTIVHVAERIEVALLDQAARHSAAR